MRGGERGAGGVHPGLLSGAWTEQVSLRMQGRAELSPRGFIPGAYPRLRERAILVPLTGEAGGQGAAWGSGGGGWRRGRAAGYR